MTEAARDREHVVLEAGDATVIVGAHGSRVTSLLLAGRELLVQPGAERLLSGCYPMVPWAGRLGLGRFDHDGAVVQMPIDHPPHAIHGLGTTTVWQPAADGFELDLTDRWPLGGAATTSFALTAEALTMEVSFTAGMLPAPVVLGWHPCFRRYMGDDGGGVHLEFRAEHWWPRGADGLPTGTTALPPAGPWDDCFGGVQEAPRIAWPGGPTVVLNAAIATWVVYDETDHAVCVEPQTAPPNAHNLGLAPIVEPRGSVSLSLTLSWSN